MAGARLVEEVLARGGGDALSTSPCSATSRCGNYNRILLSGVLAGSHDPKDIFINPLSWYAANGVDAARRRARRAASISPRSRSSATSGTRRAVRHARDRHRQPAVGAADRRAVATATTRHGFKRRRLRLPHARRLRSACCACAATVARRAAVIGGGLLGLEAARGLLNAGLDVHVVHLMAAPDGRRSSMRPAAGCCSGSSSRWACTLHLEQDHDGGARR